MMALPLQTICSANLGTSTTSTLVLIFLGHALPFTPNYKARLYSSVTCPDDAILYILDDLLASSCWHTLC